MHLKSRAVALTQRVQLPQEGASEPSPDGTPEPVPLAPGAQIQQQMAAVEAERKAALQRQSDAQALSEALAGEAAACRRDLTACIARQCTLLGDALRAALTLCYLGTFPQGVRDMLLNWTQAQAVSSGFPCAAVPDPVVAVCHLGDAPPRVPRRKGSLGLPDCDRVRDNFAVVAHGSRFPVLIDPQGVARAWLRRTAPDLLTLQHDAVAQQIKKTLAFALPRSLPVLVEGGLPRTLPPVLHTLVHAVPFSGGKNGTPHVMIDEDAIELGPEARVYFACLSADDLSSELVAVLSPVDFTLDAAALQVPVPPHPPPPLPRPTAHFVRQIYRQSETSGGHIRYR